MKLKLTLMRAGGHIDVVAAIDTTTTVGDLALALDRRDPARSKQQKTANPTLSIHTQAGPRAVNPDLDVMLSGVRSGSVVSIGPASQLSPVVGVPAVASLRVLTGPDAGRTFDLHVGTNVVGRARGCDVRFTDPMVSKRHAKINVGAVIEVIDDQSANGVMVGDELVPRVVVGADEPVTIGESVFVVTGRTGSTAGLGPTVEFNRSPRVAPVYAGVTRVAPEPPQPPQRQRLPILSMMAPALMGLALFVITRSVMSIAFVALSPLMMLGSFLEGRRTGSAAFKEAVEQFHASLADLTVQLQHDEEIEREARQREHPSTAACLDGAFGLSALLWTRRPEHAQFLDLSLGLGIQRSRNTVEVPSSRNTTPDLWAELTEVSERFSNVDDVPVIARLRECGAVGVSGPDELAHEVANGLITQAVVLHSPAEVLVCAMAPTARAGEWQWLKWMPHTNAEASSPFTSQLASTTPACLTLIAELEALIAARAGAGAEGVEAGRDDERLPAVLVVVDDETPVERHRLVSLAERGSAAAVHVLWVAPTPERVPAACRTFLSIDRNNGGALGGNVISGELVQPVVPGRVDSKVAEQLGRQLSPVTDAGASNDAEADLPSTVAYLAESGVDLASDPHSVLERWMGSASLPIPDDLVGVKLKRDQGLRALVGRSSAESFHLDLRAQGPHALVGGTTGAGKSEFLQTWILGLAAANSPLRVTFLFVDYKGGAAFSDCVNLPHCVGLVTDLSPHLVGRALTSLNAELRRREHLLNRKKAKDVLELERRRDPEAPPSLVLVVDEFAALVAEVPEFVDGVVNIAQRGRSLGLHLILATQRPAGVIKDNLRANTNLRVALRMADDDDSVDVVGTALAAGFDPSVPGRAIAKAGPGRLTPFQAGYVGGWTPDEPLPPPLVIRELGFGADIEWEDLDAVIDAPETEPGPTDIARVVSTIGIAASTAGIAPPRRPWLPELAAVYELADLPTDRRDSDLVFGVLDSPSTQSQPVVSFQPDRDGNMAVMGTGGTGKSAFLRSIAVSAGLTVRGGRCVVYGIDFAGRGLEVLERLPHVGSIIAGDDEPRISRLLKQLRETIDERAGRYAQARAGSITEYRQLADQPEEPRVILLVDNVGAFRQSYESNVTKPLWAAFESIATDGRQVGVHVVVAADRPAAISAALGSAVQRRLVLRLANEMDLMMVGVPMGGFSASSPAGRGFIGDSEVQVAVLGGTQNVAGQGQAIEHLAASMRRAGVAPAPAIETLPERISLSALPATVHGSPTLGVADETLQPIGFVDSGMFLVTGPPESGCTTVMATLATSIRHAEPERRLYYVGNSRSQLASMVDWTEIAVSQSEIESLAERLSVELTGSAGRVSAALFVDDVPSFLNGPSDYTLQELLAVCKRSDVMVVGDGEVGSVNGSWPLLQLIRSGRQGLALQPEQTTGDFIFQTPFPRVSRAEFPPGRGFYVRSGRALRVQVAVPE